MVKQYAKQTWKKLSSPQARANYKKAGAALGRAGNYASQYATKTNNALDNIVGTRDPSPRGKLSGVALPKGYTVKRVPTIVSGPRGHSIFYETKLVKTNGKRKTPVKKKKPTNTRKKRR